MHSPAATDGDNGGMRVLVVEDESKLAELLARGLREEGHPPTRPLAVRKGSGWPRRRRTTRSCWT